MREDILAFVQFIHPGKEQNESRPGWRSWNRRKSNGSFQHRRKFLVTAGSCVGRQDMRSFIGFWGEWEPPSRVSQVVDAMKEPRYFHIPIFVKPPRDVEGLLDTDPFVFGERFLYTGCQQHMNHNIKPRAVETMLRRLAPGSVIVFGASMNKRFAIDTVLVVKDYVDYPKADYRLLAGHGIPMEYQAITLEPSAAESPTVDSFRLYFGATIDEPMNGMFSYVPCRLLKDAPRGFVRPTLNLPGLITPTITQGRKGTRMNIEEMQRAWNAVRMTVEKAGCDLGHAITLPKTL